MSSKRVLDTSILIQHWKAHWKETLGVSEVRALAKQLGNLRRSTSIVTPVVIEFLAGTRDSHELRMSREFLSELNVIDNGDVRRTDWQQAQSLAERVRQDGKSTKARHLGDCLIAALANRLHHDVDTLDSDMPRIGAKRH